MNFDIKTEQLSDDTYVISLAGEVDLYTAPEFKQQLLEVIGQGGKEVIVDFSGTTFIDSAGVTGFHSTGISSRRILRMPWYIRDATTDSGAPVMAAISGCV